MDAERHFDRPVQSVDDLASRLGTSASALCEIAESADNRYWPPKPRPKRSAGRRFTQEPHTELKAIQQRISGLLWRRVTSLVLERCRERAARAHERSPWVAQLDLKDFFPHVMRRLVRDALADAGFGGEALDVLVALVIRHGRLVQGAPSSPAVSNLVLAKLDAEIAGQARATGLTVTRLGDDFAISGSSRCAVEQMLGKLISRLRDLDLPVNRHKIRIDPRHKVQLLHGLALNNGASIPKRKKTAPDRLSRDWLRSAVRRAQRFGATDAERAKLMGQISCLARLHPTEAQQLRRLLGSAPEG